MTPRLVFLHGLESGPHGSKYQALRGIDPEIISPDCEGINDIEDRLAVINRELEGIKRMVLVGSSFGGLAALLFAEMPENRDRVVGCLLCAPAVSLAKPGQLGWVPPRTIVLQGTQDDLVPWEESAAFCHKHGLQFVKVDDDHRLSKSRELVVQLAKELL